VLVLVPAGIHAVAGTGITADNVRLTMDAIQPGFICKGAVYSFD
jgi:hypothetical protein